MWAVHCVIRRRYLLMHSPQKRRRWSRIPTSFSMVRKCETWDSSRATMTVHFELNRGSGFVSLRTCCTYSENTERVKKKGDANVEFSSIDRWGLGLRSGTMISGLSHAVYVPFRGLDLISSSSVHTELQISDLLKLGVDFVVVDGITENCKMQRSHGTQRYRSLSSVSRMKDMTVPVRQNSPFRINLMKPTFPLFFLFTFNMILRDAMSVMIQLESFFRDSLVLAGFSSSSSLWTRTSRIDHNMQHPQLQLSRVLRFACWNSIEFSDSFQSSIQPLCIRGILVLPPTKSTSSMCSFFSPACASGLSIGFVPVGCLSSKRRESTLDTLNLHASQDSIPFVSSGHTSRTGSVTWIIS